MMTMMTSGIASLYTKAATEEEEPGNPIFLRALAFMLHVALAWLSTRLF